MIEHVGYVCADGGETLTCLDMLNSVGILVEPGFLWCPICKFRLSNLNFQPPRRLFCSECKRLDDNYAEWVSSCGSWQRPIGPLLNPNAYLHTLGGSHEINFGTQGEVERFRVDPTVGVLGPPQKPEKKLAPGQLPCRCNLCEKLY
jgi:hypothetical protein